MKQLDKVLNVHIIPIGMEIDRAVLPLHQLGAHKAVLLGDEKPDDVGIYFEKEIRKAIKEKCPLVTEVERESWDDWRNLRAIMAKMTEIIRREQEQGNHTWINIASGAQLTGIAGTMVAMMHGSRAYYVQAKDYKRRRMKTPPTEGIEAILELPRYTIDTLEDKHVLLLNLISKYERAKPKTIIKELLDTSKNLMKKGVIKEELLRTKDEKGKDLGQNAQLAVFRRNYVDVLESWDYIERIGAHRGTTYAITEEGKTVLEIHKNGNPLIKNL